MKSFWFLLFSSNLILSHQAYHDTNTFMIYKWRFAEFDYPNEAARDEAVQQEEFIPTNVAIMDVDYHAPTDRYFVSSPPFRKGIPATLSQVISQRGTLKPFPSWPNNENNETMCEGPVSVFRMQIDRCGHLWALDSGKGDNFNRAKFFCSPKLLVYDLNNYDRLLLSYELPNTVYTDRSSLINIITESYQNDCSDSFAYIADANDHGLIVFDYAQQKSWRIENKYFFPYPTEATVTLNNVTYEAVAGILGMALGPETMERERNLYFHAFNSIREGWVSVNVLKDQTVSLDRFIRQKGFYNSPGTRAGQSTVEVMTDDGVLIYTLIPMNAIACWNSKTPFTIENQHILQRDDENFQFISSMKLKGNSLLLMSTRFQNYMVGKANGTDFKYRVMVIDDVKRLLWNTPCSPDTEYVRSEYTDPIARTPSPYDVFGRELQGESSGFSYDNERGEWATYYFPPRIERRPLWS